MIRSYSDHAANERTFLAWVRTGIAVIAFGFVIEKFNLFVLTIASSTSSEATQRLLERLQGHSDATTATPSSSAGSRSSSWQPCASCAPGGCSTTPRRTPPTASAPS